jgi:hypothetical protein
VEEYSYMGGNKVALILVLFILIGVLCNEVKYFYSEMPSSINMDLGSNTGNLIGN